MSLGIVTTWVNKRARPQYQIDSEKGDKRVKAVPDSREEEETASNRSGYDGAYLNLLRSFKECNTNKEFGESVCWEPLENAHHDSLAVCRNDEFRATAVNKRDLTTPPRDDKEEKIRTRTRESNPGFYIIAVKQKTLVDFYDTVRTLTDQMWREEDQTRPNCFGFDKFYFSLDMATIRYQQLKRFHGRMYFKKSKVTATAVNRRDPEKSLEANDIEIVNAQSRERVPEFYITADSQDTLNDFYKTAQTLTDQF
ncbi:hypothetical protein BDW74DRAFT_175691 [Aspergillus multicolor]|uniref:uncharacterized protein n=1 Tax=Aspergillus multicolor TaxID=41759 RepID=UPI003CCD4BF5